MESMKATGMKGSFCGVSFVQGITQNVFFPFFPWRDRQGDEETCVDGSGNVW